MGVTQSPWACPASFRWSSHEPGRELTPEVLAPKPVFSGPQPWCGAHVLRTQGTAGHGAGEGARGCTRTPCEGGQLTDSAPLFFDIPGKGARSASASSGDDWEHKIPTQVKRGWQRGCSHLALLCIVHPTLWLPWMSFEFVPQKDMMV